MKIIPFHDDADIKIFNRIFRVMKRLSSEGVFCGTYSRLATSVFAFLINDKGKDVGFVYFVDENVDNVLFVDVGFIPEVRGTGLANAAISEIIKMIGSKYDVFLVSEISNDNIAAIKSTERRGAIKIGDKHYLLQPDKYNEFIKHMSSLGINIDLHNYSERSF